MFISAIDMTIVNVALPEMSNELDAGIGELQWVLDAFLVSLAGLLLVGNGLADRFGRRRVFVLGLDRLRRHLRAGGRVADGGRADRRARADGSGRGVCVPPSLSLLVVLFPPELRAKAAGIWAAVAGLGLALGPVVGGVLVDVAGWRWVFLVNVPFVLVAASLGLRWLPESRRPGVPPLDLPGVALSTLGLRGIVFALIEGVDAGWTSPAVLSAAVVGVRAGVAFVAAELRRRHPLFDVRVLARARVAAGALVIFAAYVAMLGMLFLLPQCVRYVQEGSALASGARGRAVRPRARLLGGAERAARREARAARRPACGAAHRGGRVRAAAAALRRQLARARAARHRASSAAASAPRPAGDGGDHERPGHREGRRRGGGEPRREAGRRRARCGDRRERVRRGLRGRDRRRRAACLRRRRSRSRGRPTWRAACTARPVSSSSNDAVAAFDVAARWGLAVCMAVILLAAAGAAIGLSRVPPAKELPGRTSGRHVNNAAKERTLEVRR